MYILYIWLVMIIYSIAKLTWVVRSCGWTNSTDLHLAILNLKAIAIPNSKNSASVVFLNPAVMSGGPAAAWDPAAPATSISASPKVVAAGAVQAVQLEVKG
jgi:hypothetical protein